MRMVVVNIVTITAYTGARDEIFPYLRKIAEYAHENHLGVYTARVFLSTTHPDRLVLFRRFRDDDARKEHLQSSVFRSYVNKMTNELQLIKQIHYTNYIEQEGIGFLCRQLEHHNESTMGSSISKSADPEPPPPQHFSSSTTCSSSPPTSSPPAPAPAAPPSSCHRVAHLVTATANPGKRMELIALVRELADSGDDVDVSVYTWLVLLSETHPDRFVVLKRFSDEPSRIRHTQSDVVAKKFQKIAASERSLLKHVEYTNYIEYDGAGWTCRDHVNVPVSTQNTNINTDNGNEYQIAKAGDMIMGDELKVNEGNEAK